MMTRTGYDVRVIVGSTFTRWIEYLDWSPHNTRANGVEKSVQNVHLEKADFVLIAFTRDGHWSLLGLCNPGVSNCVAVLRMSTNRTVPVQDTHVHTGRLLTETVDPTKPPILLHIDSTRKHEVASHLTGICGALGRVMTLRGEVIKARLHLFTVRST